MRALGSLGALLVLVSCSDLPQPVSFDGPLGKPDPIEAATPTGDGGYKGDGVKPTGDGSVQPGKFDWHDGIMYFVLLDRFLDGDATNNSQVAGCESQTNYQGGDLAGVLKKLKDGYFEQLGVNVLWLSSPVDAPETKWPGRLSGTTTSDGHNYTGYHGYWPVELDKIEGRLGDLTLLEQVVTEAHNRGIKVLLDYVMNHVHIDSSVWTNHQDYFWNNPSCLCGNGPGCNWDPKDGGTKCWFDPFLPTFNFTNAAARAYSVGDAMSWITKAKVDGYRLDAIKQVEMSWLTDLRSRLNKEVTGRFYLIGETFDGNRDLIKSFVDPTTKLDGQFDFPLRAAVVRIVLMRQGGMGDLDSFLASNDSYYGANAIMGTFLGNHDLPRTIHLAEDTPQFGEWDTAKDRAWTNQPSLPGAASAFERLGLGFAVLMTLPGIPMIYYGDEIGMAGAGDPDNRKMMTWSGTTTNQDNLRTKISKLIQIRRQHAALRQGTRQKITATTDLYVYKMVKGTDALIVAINRSDSEQSFSLTGSTFTDLLTGESIPAGTVKVPARSARILQ
jgi:glycosidase